MKLGYVIALSAAMCAVPASAARVIYDETISFSSGQSDLRSFNLKSGRSYEFRLTSETARLDLEIVGNYVEFRYENGEQVFLADNPFIDIYASTLSLETSYTVPNLARFTRNPPVNIPGFTGELTYWVNAPAARLSAYNVDGSGGSARYQIIDTTTSAPPPVPEPATWAMMIGGFGMIGGAMRRRARVHVAFR